MASEVNHHVGYSRENECWFVRFYPYQTEQQASEAAAAFTLPAPAATDTGLETVGYTNKNYTSIWRGEQCCNPEYKIAVVTRSQAEELLAAEIRRERDLAEKQLSEVVDRMSDDYLALKADNAAKETRIKELEEEVEWAQNAVLARQRHAEARCETLEAKLAAAEKALEFYANRENWKNGRFEQAEGGTVLRHHPSSVHKDRGAKARAVLGGNLS